MKKENKKTVTCNQCFKQLHGCGIYQECVVYFCANPKCPNYSLYQFSVEEMKSLGDKRFKAV